MRTLKLWHVALLVVVGSFIYFYHLLLKGLVPIPADALTGLYHPFRDLFAGNFPNGIPYKNFLLTDPVRQIIPWKELAWSQLIQFQLPLWNPYEMTGKPLLGNFQSSPFYPLNILLSLHPFEIGWTLFIASQQILGSIFMFLYLKGQKVSSWIALFSGMVFAFSGFVIAWLEWGTVGHTILWLPLLLLCIDKLIQGKASKKYMLLFVIGTTASLFAGHLQTFVYVYIIAIAYFFVHIYGYKITNKKDKIIKFLLLNLLFILITLIQWYPTLQFLLLSARDLDQTLSQPGWFIPPQHLVQFIAPDFFGNPATLNYWGVFNYAEFVGYIGLAPLVAAISVIGRKKKNIIFFQAIVLASLIIAVDNPLTRFLYSLEIPFFTSTQPTRLIGPVTFALLILSAFGLKQMEKGKNKKSVLITLAAVGVVFLSIWVLILTNFTNISQEALLVTKRNFILPTTLFAVVATGFLGAVVLHKHKLFVKISICVILAVTAFGLTRFATKFTPFSSTDYFYPSSKTIQFLQGDKDIFRIATVDDRLLAPNIPTWYRIQSIDGYDPLYLKSFAEYTALNEREENDIDPPYGFNRIITPKNYNTQLFDFLNTKYVLSLNEIEDEKLVKVFEEGQTKIYENTQAFPRAFMVQNVVKKSSNTDIATSLLTQDLKTTAFTTEELQDAQFATGSARIEKYSENEMFITTESDGQAFLVISDAFYPTWHVKVNGKESKIYRININFRGVVVPAGKNSVMFYTKLL